LAVALIAALLMVGRADGLPAEAYRALGIFTLCLYLWVTQIIPLAATGLLAIALVSMIGIMTPARAFSFFGNSAVFFLLGVFLLTAAMIRTGLSKRLTLLFLERFDRSPRFLLLGVLTASAVLALFMPEHAVAAMIFPVVLEVVKALELKPYGSEYGKALFIAMGWGAIIGGVGTFLGGARAPLAVELLANSYGIRISFLQWAVAVMPVVPLMLVPAYFMLSRSFRMDVTDVTRARLFLQNEIRRIGPPSPREYRMGALMLLTIITWVFLGHRVNLATISILAATGLFFLRVVRWHEVEEYVNWGVIVMYGGAIMVGNALTETHAIEWVTTNLLGIGGLSPFGIMIFLIVASILLTEGISNVATVAVMVPLGFGLVESLHISPLLVVLAVTVPAGLPFCLPIGSPPNAIAYSSRFFDVGDVIRRGLFLNLAAVIILILVARFYWPLLGLVNW
ncbi:DASS family sodium-coupled anion symporter, partial [bacterium]|nr:DASS family sodium-coupled anion symporter [candidate division CSSED10-310 bacterium]